MSRKHVRLKKEERWEGLRSGARVGGGMGSPSRRPPLPARRRRGWGRSVRGGRGATCAAEPSRGRATHVALGEECRVAHPADAAGEGERAAGGPRGTGAARRGPPRDARGCGNARPPPGSSLRGRASPAGPRSPRPAPSPNRVHASGAARQSRRRHITSSPAPPLLPAPLSTEWSRLP